VELLVATAITLVVLGLMVQISFSVLGTFDKVTGTVTARTQASTVLRFLREDFQSIVWRRDGNVWLLATVQPDQVGAGQTQISDADWDLTLDPDENPKPGRGAVGDYGKDLSSLRFDEQGSTGKWIDASGKPVSGSDSLPIAPQRAAAGTSRLSPFPIRSCACCHGVTAANTAISFSAPKSVPGGRM
jgi:Tfp pilus assembly protein PilW